MSAQKEHLLIGFYGRGNFGDDWMCSSLLKILGEKKQSNINVFCDNLEFLTKSYPQAKPVSRKLSSLISKIKSSDHLIQGGGTIFHDSYKGVFKYKYLLNLVRWALLFRYAKFCGNKIIITGAGIGPIESRAAKKICSYTLQLADTIIVRDTPSFEEVSQLLGSSEKLAIGCDLTECYKDDTNAKPLPQKNRVVIGISVCDLTPFMNTPQDNNLFWRTFTDNLQQLINHYDEPTLKFLSLYQGSSSTTDKQVSDQICSLLNYKNIKHTVYENDTSSFISEIDECDLVIATKFHAVVAAHKLSKPTLAICYNRKVMDYGTEKGLNKKLLIDIHSNTKDWGQAFATLINTPAPQSQNNNSLKTIKLIHQALSL